MLPDGTGQRIMPLCKMGGTFLEVMHELTYILKSDDTGIY